MILSSTRLLATYALIAIVFVAGCGQSSDPVTFAKKVPASKEVPVEFKYPTGWKLTEPGEITDGKSELSFAADDVTVGNKDDAQSWLRDYAYSGDDVKFDDLDGATVDAFSATWTTESDDDSEGREIREYYYKDSFDGDVIWIAALVARGPETGDDLNTDTADQVAATVRIDKDLAKDAIEGGVESFEEDDDLT
jgi:hypothetical protein